MTTPVASTGPAHAGLYAEYDGVIWPASYHPRSGPVGLLAYADEPPWREHEEPRREGRWERVVPRRACTRLFWVATSAYWAGVYPAEVTRARGNGLVEISCSPLSAWPGTPDAVRDLDWAAPRRRLWEERGVGYYGTVPETELTHVTSETHEIGIEEPNTWTRPHVPMLPPPTEPTPPQDPRTRRKRLQ